MIDELHVPNEQPFTETEMKSEIKRARYPSSVVVDELCPQKEQLISRPVMKSEIKRARYESSVAVEQVPGREEGPRHKSTRELTDFLLQRPAAVVFLMRWMMTS